MLTDFDGLAAQIEDPVPIPVRAAYLRFASARISGAWSIRPSGHGYIARELRFEKHGRWYYSAVLNKSWVLFYFRKPCFSDQLLDWERVQSEFPEATVAQEANLTLRVTSADQARRVVEFICR